MEKNNHQYIVENLGLWTNMWDQALKDGLFNDLKPKAEPDEIKIDPYLPQMAGLDVQLMQEETTPNPVYPDSVGKDQDQPKPVWVDEKLTKEIEELKNKMFELENKLAQTSGDYLSQNKNDSDIMKKIESIRKDIDQVSNSLGTKDEPSPWTVSKK